MKISSVSTYVMGNYQRPLIAQGQSDLMKASYEATMGRVYDPGLTLGRQTGRFIGNENQMTSLNGLKTSNSLAAQRMASAQAAMQSLVFAGDKDTASGSLVQFNNALMGDPVTTTPKTIQSAAQAALDSFVSAMNTSYNGEYVFGGTNTSQPPLDYYKAGSNTGGSKVVQDAFRNHFGFGPDDPKVADISADDMKKFIDGPFNDLFEEPSWSTNFSKAEDGAVMNRISPNGETVDISVSANEDGFRHAMKNMILVAEFGNIGLSDDAQAAVGDRARASSDSKATGSAISQIITTASSLGNSENRVSQANKRIDAQVKVLNSTRNDLIGVDPAEASNRMITLENMLNISYNMTARISKMSLVNYI
ncbi:flagellar hook-associated family protein [Bartonella sp. LJL80]